jgi:KipI family sensor histidine kinase inhibitor
MSETSSISWRRPQIVPLGDAAVLVRFGASLDDGANSAALKLAQRLSHAPIDGVLEVVPSLVSVLVRYDPGRIEPFRLSGEIALLLEGQSAMSSSEHAINVRFGGEGGPDLEFVAESLGLSVSAFVDRHCAVPLRVLATGFAPGFVYCGFHPEGLALPRRHQVRAKVSVGSVLFAARQTAIAATDIPTGWHVIGRTDFRNFDATQMPPTHIAAGDLIRFEAVA